MASENRLNTARHGSGARFDPSATAVEPPAKARRRARGRLPFVETRQLESTTGFVIYDLPDAEHYVGQARLGAKLAPGNATMLVRHQTYVFATLEQRKSGATIGFKVDPEGGADAIAAAAGELEDELTSNRLLTSPGLRLDRDQIDPFLRHDQRNAIGQSDRDVDSTIPETN